MLSCSLSVCLLVQEFASRTLAECCASGSYKDLASFVSAVDAQQGGQGLQSLLIMPIQRVPRYVLLLQVGQKRRTPVQGVCRAALHSWLVT